MTLATVLSLVLAVAAFTIATALPSVDSDLYWHLASGRWMVEHRALIDHDPFSATARGAPYTSGQWLGQLAFYGAYALGGWQGIAVLRGALVGVMTFFAARATLLVQPRPLAAVAALLPALAVTKTTWTDRPQLASLALFAVLLFVLLRAHLGAQTQKMGGPGEGLRPAGPPPSQQMSGRGEGLRPAGPPPSRAEGGRPPISSLWLLPPLVAIWANLHGGYVLGLGVMALFAVAAFVERRPHRRELAVALAISAVVGLLNPTSFSALGAARYASGPTRFIQEELPPDVFSDAGALFAALLLVALASAFVGGADAGRGSGLLWLVLLPPLAWLGLSAQRHLPLASLALAPYVALAAPAAIARVAPRARLAEPRRLRARPGIAGALARLSQAPPARDVKPGMAGALLFSLTLAAVGAAVSAPAAPDESRYPQGAVAALRETRGNLLNEYDWGGYLIWRLPERAVFIDGRGYTLFAPDVYADYFAAVELGVAFREVLERRDIEVLLLRPSRPLAVYLRESGWHVRAEEPGGYVLLVRP